MSKRKTLCAGKEACDSLIVIFILFPFLYFSITFSVESRGGGCEPPTHLGRWVMLRQGCMYITCVACRFTL